MSTPVNFELRETPQELKAYDQLLKELDEAEHKAIDSLARYKFQMFGYWAAIWVHLNRISGAKRPSPFKSIVNQARICAGGIQ